MVKILQFRIVDAERNDDYMLVESQTKATPVQNLFKNGQQVYYDGMSREDLQKGFVENIVTQGAKGLTSNPVIFEKSFASDVYDEQIEQELKANPNLTPEQLFELCAIQDIQAICDGFLKLYEHSDADHGYVSMEVSPMLAGDHAATQAEARRLWQAVNRPNLFIKIPSTDIAVLEQLTYEGIKINVTLLFTVEDTLAAAQAIMAGLERRAQAGLDNTEMRSVLSHFVSRIDKVANGILDKEASEPVLQTLRQQVAVMNSYRAHHELEVLKKEYRSLNLSKQFPVLLLASTGNKEKDRYPEDVYVAPLALPGTINTMPTPTYNFLVESGKVYQPARYQIKRVQELLAMFEKIASLETICTDLKAEGVVLFQEAYQKILERVRRKIEQFQAN